MGRRLDNVYLFVGEAALSGLVPNVVSRLVGKVGEISLEARVRPIAIRRPALADLSSPTLFVLKVLPPGENDLSVKGKRRLKEDYEAIGLAPKEL